MAGAEQSFVAVFPNENRRAAFLNALRAGGEAIKELYACRNELCLYCGKYKNAHLGACTGCRWEK